MEALRHADYDTVDLFTDLSLAADPYPYFEHLRQVCPVAPLSRHGVVAVTRFEETIDVLRDTETFSSCNSVTGPFPGLSVRPRGDDIGELIERHRHELPMSDYLVTQDGPTHTARRFLPAASRLAATSLRFNSFGVVIRGHVVGQLGDLHPHVSSDGRLPGRYQLAGRGGISSSVKRRRSSVRRGRRRSLGTPLRGSRLGGRPRSASAIRTAAWLSRCGNCPAVNICVPGRPWQHPDYPEKQRS